MFPRTHALVGGLLALLLAGCDPATVPSGDLPVSSPATTPDELRSEIDGALSYTLEGRQLSLEQHAAWQILHGVLAFGGDFPVRKEGQPVPVVPYLMEGGSMKGWDLEVVTREDGSHGLRALLDAGTKAGQGHADQWLAILAQCDLPSNQMLKWEGKEYQLADLLQQVMADLPRNYHREYSWTVIGLSAYLDPDATWLSSDGQPWSIERLIQIEVEQDLGSSACGGTHRLIGMTMALNHYLREHPELRGQDPLPGVWQAVRTRIAESVDRARQYQNPDGSFSVHYFERAGLTPDLEQNLGRTGHIVEFLALALDRERLQEPWVRRSVAYLCKLFRKTEGIPLECGALYHAAHGLVLYRDKVYGAQSPGKADPEPAVQD